MKKPHDYLIRWHECGWSSTWDVFVLFTDGSVEPLMVPALFDPSFSLRAQFSTEDRARSFVASLGGSHAQA